jgi:hypothetical protein
MLGPSFGFVTPRAEPEMTWPATDSAIFAVRFPAASQGFDMNQLKTAEVGKFLTTRTKLSTLVVGRTFSQQFDLQLAAACQFFLASLLLTCFGLLTRLGRPRFRDGPSANRRLPLQRRPFHLNEASVTSSVFGVCFSTLAQASFRSTMSRHSAIPRIRATSAGM